MTLILGKKKCREGLNVCMNDEFNLLHHVGVVAKRVRAAAAEAAETAAAHEGDDNTPSGPTGREVKTAIQSFRGGGVGAGLFISDKLFISTWLGGALNFLNLTTCLCGKVSKVNYLLFIHPKLFISKGLQPPPPPSWDLMVAPLLSTNFKPTAVSMLQNRKGGGMLGMYTGMYVVSSGFLVSWYSIIASTSIMVPDTKFTNRSDNSQA